MSSRSSGRGTRVHGGSGLSAIRKIARNAEQGDGRLRRSPRILVHRRSTQSGLYARLRPSVRESLDGSGVAARYNGLVSIVHDLTGTMAPTSSFDRLRTLCADVGFDLERIRPSILDRMRLLAETTETVNDCERAVRIANEVFRYYDVIEPLKRFTALERRIVVIGSIFSDIGKSGPAGATLDGQHLVAEMFAVEGIVDERMSVARFFEVYFPADAAQRARRFGALGLDPGMTMRGFWNLHSAWTLHVLQGDGVPMEAVPAAATHHILENVNPDSLVADDGRFTKYFGKHASFERPEKLVILLDKYDAALRRGHCTHDQAIASLREVIAKNHRFRGDHGFLELIEDLDDVMKVPEGARGSGRSPCVA